MTTRARIRALLAILGAALALERAAAAADWLNEGGDAKRANVQPFEERITPASASALKLIWKRTLGEGARLSAPVIMGRLITYRGTVELVFVASADGHVYAVDADFGTVFWTRRLESGVKRCQAPATPALTPNPPGVDPDDDGPQPKRDLYVLAPDAMLYTLDPIDGKDAAAPRRLGCAASLVVKNGKPELAAAPRAVASWRDSAGARHRFPNAVVAGGVAFAVSKPAGELSAFDALNGKPLFRSAPVGADPGALAEANGHVCFSASEATLYCFGFPAER